MSDLYHLAYLSQSTLGDNQVFIRNEVEQILAAAKRNNPPRNVTGALLYSGEYFCQLLEGPAAEVEHLFEVIMSDDRHQGIEILFFDPAPDRYFGALAMAFAGYDDRPPFKIMGIKASRDDIHARALDHSLVDAMSRLVAAWERGSSR